MEQRFLIDGRYDKAPNYEEYLKQWKNYVDITNPSDLDEKSLKNFEFSKLNLHRTNRVHKTYKPSELLVNLISEFTEKQRWMVITEHWCGDSGQNLPYIAEIAKLNDLIELKIIERDSNLDIMDQYLTNGKSRSIPKLVVFNKDGSELFQWGPRPEYAQNFYRELKEQNVPKSERDKQLHLWYGRNRGVELEKEFIELFESIKDPV